ncbi:DMT family transporter [Dyadobacter sp. NIV53]|uniref:EamA family transporter n=1 Tax=Dyadobacter sp. NIV53 TaxID=2861765 RepID=UPI001C871693|nr:DMT family transporter [Dyadobacter sp. NIV53]
MNSKVALFKLPPIPAVLLSIISVQGGAAIAKGLFPLLGAGGTASVRIGFSALILVLAVRPKLGQLKAEQWRAVAPYGIVLGIMNLLFYCALARVPMGLAVTLEFIGPLVLALAGSRRALDILWVVLAGAGIALITPWSGKGIDLLGLFFALAAGGCWAIYILLSQRAGAQLPGQLAVTVGMLFAALPVLPIGLIEGNLFSMTPFMLLLGLLLAIFSSVLPFSLEMQALRTMPSRTFSILMSLEPAVAALAGWWLLGEQLKSGQWLAVVCIVAASSGAALTAKQTLPPLGSE